MAQLKSTVVQGSLRVTDTIFSTDLNLSSLTASYAVLTDANKNLVSRGILNNTSAGALGWNNNGNTNADNLRFMTVNTLAYWNGAYTGTTSNISVLGTVTTGTWSASTIAVDKGGTGKTSWTQWGVLYASASTTLANTSAGTAGYLLQSNATSAPDWIQATDSNIASTIVKRNANGDFTTRAITLNRTDPGNYITLQQNGTESGSLKLETLGTTSAEGMVTLTLGNSSASTVDKNASGKLTLYNSTGTGFSFMTDAYGVLLKSPILHIQPTNSTPKLALDASGDGIWGQVRVDSTAYTGSTYTTINQTEWGSLWYQIPAKKNSDNSIVIPQWFFKAYSYNSSTGAKLEYMEQYSFPYITAGLTAHKYYNILTSKGFDGTSTTWNKGRDVAQFKMTSITGYSVPISIKTPSGSWDIGIYDDSGWSEELIFSYIPDTLYNGTNTQPSQIRFKTTEVDIFGAKIFPTNDGVRLVRSGSTNQWVYVGGNETSGTKGFYVPGYNGGWCMQDADWIRSYNSKGVYSGSGIIKSDNAVWGNSVVINSNWIGFYNAVQGTTRYGYIQANADRMYFRKENGVNTYAFDFNGHVYTNSSFYAPSGSVWAGTNGNTTAERQVGVQSGAGQLYLYSQPSASGSRGLYIPAHGTGAAKSVIAINTNNDATFYGAVSGGAISGSSITASNGWLYTTGSTGWCNSTYSGGWFMQDTTWVRSYNSKSVYTGSGQIRSDNAVWGNKILVNYDWIGFYAAAGSTATRYGYIQCNATDMRFIKENSSSTHTFYFNARIHTAAQNFGTTYWQYHGTSTQIQFKFNATANAFNWPDGSTKYHITSAGAAGSGSSRVLKHNIMPIETIGEKLDKLEPITFSYNDDPYDTKFAGLIFEDTINILPEICIGSVDEPEDAAINYAGLTPFLLKEIQELRKRVKILEQHKEESS